MLISNWNKTAWFIIDGSSQRGLPWSRLSKMLWTRAARDGERRSELGGNRTDVHQADLSSTPRKSREGDVAGVLAEVAGSGSGHVGRGSVRAPAGRGLLRSALCKTRLQVSSVKVNSATK